MKWKDILKNDERNDLDVQLDRAIEEWGMELDISDFEYFADGNGPNLSGIEIEVTFEDSYEGDEDLSQEEKLEQDAGHYRIDFRTEKGDEFAMADYTYDNGYEVHELDTGMLETSEIKAAIRALGGNVLGEEFKGLGDYI